MEQENKKELSGESSNAIVKPIDEIVKDDINIDGFLELRAEFIKKVSAICVEGKDYHIIKGKKSLAKGGAEKIASIFQWTSKFDMDNESLEMLGKVDGLVAFKCSIFKGDQYAGEGRGAATLKGNDNDPNKTLKMAQKSAFIDAVLRASGLSDFFTQDLEDMDQSKIDRPQQNQVTNHANTFEKPTDKQIELIKSLKEQKYYTSKEVIDAVGFVPGRQFSKADASKIIEWLMQAPINTIEFVNDVAVAAKQVDKGVV